jgi:TolB-like protein/Tfp pilus assembly protein PilF
MSGDKEQEYFSDGLAEEIINALTRIPGLKVIARTSSFAFRGKEQDITKIAEMLRVRSILEGSVRRAGNRIRVTAQLIDATDGSHLWSERYDREMNDVFAIQDEISQAIAEKLRVRLSGERPFAKRHTENVEAYGLYLKGHYHVSKIGGGTFVKSKEYFEQAIAVDPNYALAWYGLAYFYHLLGHSGVMRPKAAYEQSSQAAQKALELDEMLPEAHAMIAVLRAADFDWKGAEREFRRALELDPKSEDVWGFYCGYYLLPMRRMDEAVAASQKALELNPLSPFLQVLHGGQHIRMHQYDQAIEHFHNALEVDPNYIWAHTYLSLTYIQTGRFDEAVRSVETATQIAAQSPQFMGIRGAIYARAGRITDAQKILNELHEIAQKTYVPAIGIAEIYFGLGEIDKALDWYEKAVEDRHSVLPAALTHPHYDPLRSNPRWKALMGKMNVEP